MIRLTSTVRPNIPLVLQGLSRFSGVVRSTKEPLKQAVEEVVIPRIMDNFISESDAEGRRWVPLSDTRIRRDKLGLRENPILHVTGNLFRQSTSIKHWQFDGQGSTMMMTAPTPYAGLQDRGGANPIPHLGPIPARPFLNINEQDMRRIEEILVDYAIERGVL